MAAVALGNKAIGEIVKLKVSGTTQNFIVAHHGKPSSAYDDSFNGGTILVLEKILQTGVFGLGMDGNPGNGYERNTGIEWSGDDGNTPNYITVTGVAHAYSNNFYTKLDATIQPYVKQVKIPHATSGFSTFTTYTGVNGLLVKGFILSSTELGFATDSKIPLLGEKLDYFTTDARRVAYLESGVATKWWTRSPYASSNTDWNYGVATAENGTQTTGTTGPPYYRVYNYGYRPALVFPSNLIVADDGTLTAKTNVAPTTPPSITLPATIRGGASFAVSWSAATDSDGNLQGYILERETDGSGSWSQVYKGTATNTTDYLALNAAATVRYRVKAYDTEGAESDYYVGASKTVTNNQIPGAPPSITVPSVVQGGKPITITWAAATDPDNNLKGYKLERSVDGGTFTQILDTTGRTYTDNITKGWPTVAYRVLAYDTYNDVSNYTTSATRTVDNTSPPVISSGLSGDLGDKSEGFSIPYKVTDVDGGTVMVTETLDGATLRTYSASLGADVSVDLTGAKFMTILNGAHTVSINAEDETDKTADYQWTFTKTVYAAFITLAEPIAVDDPIARARINVTRQIPSDAEFKVELTNNALDPAPVWEDATASVIGAFNHLFTNTQATNGPAFNARVTARRGPSG